MTPRSCPLLLHFPAFSSVVMAAVTHRALLTANDERGSADSGLDKPSFSPTLPLAGQGRPGRSERAAEREHRPGRALTSPRPPQLPRC